MLSSNTSSTCPYNMVNFGPLAAEILSLVWGTPANFICFCFSSLLFQFFLVPCGRLSWLPVLVFTECLNTTAIWTKTGRHLLQERVIEALPHRGVAIVSVRGALHGGGVGRHEKRHELLVVVEQVVTDATTWRGRYAASVHRLHVPLQQPIELSARTKTHRTSQTQLDARFVQHRYAKTYSTESTSTRKLDG